MVTNPVNPVKLIKTLQIMSVMSVSELSGVVTATRFSDILRHPLKASVGLKQRGVLITAKSGQESVSLVAAGPPLPGRSMLYVHAQLVASSLALRLLRVWYKPV